MDKQEEHPINWHLSQCFGGDQDPDAEPPEADIVSSVAFDKEGVHLAAGDHGGRVVVWEKEENPRPRTRGITPPIEFKFLCEFQSHDPEFDYLKSAEIEERINHIQWLERPSDARFLLCANDKTVKLWKIYEKDFKAPLDEYMMDEENIVVPRMMPVETAVVAKPRGIFTNGHAYHINSVSPCSDGETFISADDLRIHVWDINTPYQCVNLVDLKPDNMEALSEVITMATFHPSSCNEFLYGTSLGSINLCDMRMNLNCTAPARVFQYEEPARSIFTDIISSICDVKYRPTDGRLVLARDFMTLKVWDTAMEREPVAIVRVHEALRSQLAVLYDNEAIFDKFECAFSHNGEYLLTGSYGNTVHSWDINGRSHSSLEATTQFKKKKGKKKKSQPSDPLDINKKALHATWHPHFNLVAVCTTNNLFVYAGEFGEQEES